MTHFAWMNLGAEQLTPPAAELDLIMCRNVTIYFDATATQRLYLALIGALAPGGWLMLGPSDALPADRRELERVEVTNAVLWRRIAPVKAAKRPATKIAATKLAGPKPQRTRPSATAARSSKPVFSPWKQARPLWRSSFCDARRFAIHTALSANSHLPVPIRTRANSGAHTPPCCRLADCSRHWRATRSCPVPIHYL